MTVIELYRKNPQRETFPPKSMFVAEDETGKHRLVCFASLIGPNCKDVLSEIGGWTVFKETMTQDEIDAFQKPASA